MFINVRPGPNALLGKSSREAAKTVDQDRDQTDSVLRRRDPRQFGSVATKQLKDDNGRRKRIGIPRRQRGQHLRRLVNKDPVAPHRGPISPNKELRHQPVKRGDNVGHHIRRSVRCCRKILFKQLFDLHHTRSL